MQTIQQGRRISTIRILRYADDDRLSYTWVMALERFFAGFSPPFVVLVGLLIMGLIALLDSVTGNFAVAVFYLVPIGLVTYARGRRVGTLMAAAAACAWLGVELAQGLSDLASGLPYWNWLTRFYVYEAIVLLVAPLRDVALRERKVAVQESETSEKLRALNQLRAKLEAEGDEHLAHFEALAELRQAGFEAETTRVG